MKECALNFAQWSQIKEIKMTIQGQPTLLCVIRAANNVAVLKKSISGLFQTIDNTCTSLESADPHRETCQTRNG